MRHAVVPALAGSVPYVIAVLEFDDAPGIRMIANIVESDVDAVRVGSRVQLAWDDIDDEVTVPRFRLAARLSGTTRSRYSTYILLISVAKTVLGRYR